MADFQLQRRAGHGDALGNRCATRQYALEIPVDPQGREMRVIVGIKIGVDEARERSER